MENEYSNCSMIQKETLIFEKKYSTEVENTYACLTWEAELPEIADNRRRPAISH